MKCKLKTTLPHILAWMGLTEMKQSAFSQFLSWLFSIYTFESTFNPVLSVGFALYQRQVKKAGGARSKCFDVHTVLLPLR